MGRYTALDDPIVDQTIEDHLQKMVRAICTRIEPKAIVLRGSFSQGEGSVVIEGGHLRFLSDYEVMAVTRHYRHRQWLRTVARQTTVQSGVETSISRVHPHNIEHHSLGNLPFGGISRPTISMYEVQNGGRTIYGEHLLNRGPAIDPRTLGIWSGLRLLLNRMAESLDHFGPVEMDWNSLRWITKTILSCADAILVVHRQYHFSYAERGRRFAELVPKLGSVTVRVNYMPDLVRRATAFKLRPALDLYPETLPVLWQQVKQVCSATLSYVVEEYLGFSCNNYSEFPQLYLSRLVQNKLASNPIPLLPAPLLQNLLLGLKFLRDRRCPPLGLFTHAAYPAYQIIYSVVPLVFLGSSKQVLQEARRWLSRVIRLDPPRVDDQGEWDYVRKRTVQAWKEMCYGLWDVGAM